jgi:hypothetical protein
LIQSCKNPSDVNPEIHTFEKKLKAFEEVRIGELGFQQLQVVINQCLKCLNKFNKFANLANLVNFLIVRSLSAPFAMEDGPAMAELTRATVLVMNPPNSIRMP